MNFPASQPPPLRAEVPGECFPYRRSVNVLLFDTDWRVGYYVQDDEDAAPQWRSACSENWKLDNVKVWTSLPPTPKY